jgi:uncharacterized membrane protein YgdD (TMEM256/DUF423 family)
MNSTNAFRIAAAVGFMGVAMGALGAHGAVNQLLVRNHSVDYWKTASMYHLIHAVVLLFIAGRSPLRFGPWISILMGIAIFSGSLYMLAVTNIGALGAITPVGGLCFLVGWLWLVFEPLA